MRLFLLPVIGTLAACVVANPGEGTRMSSAADTAPSATALKEVLGPEFARCWLDVIGDTAQLSCKRTAKSPDDPFVTKATIQARGVFPNAPPILADPVTLDLTTSATVVLGTLNVSQFPLYLIALASESAVDGALFPLTANPQTEVLVQPTVNIPQELSAEKPLILNRKFDLWPTALVYLDDGLEVGPDEDYIAAVSSLAPGNSPGEDSAASKGKLRWLIAPPSGVISVRVSNSATGQIIGASVTGPGAYAVTLRGLAAATASEVASDYPNGIPAR